MIRPFLSSNDLEDVAVIYRHTRVKRTLAFRGIQIGSYWAIGILVARRTNVSKSRPPAKSL